MRLRLHSQWVDKLNLNNLAVDDFADAIDLIRNSTSESEIIGIAAACIRALGAESFVYTSFLGDHVDPVRESRRYFIGCSPAWCQIYNMRKWFENDPFVHYAKQHNAAPITGSAITLQSAGQHEMLEMAAKYGFKSGMVIPAHTGNIRHMGMLYVGSSEDRETGEPRLLRNRVFFRSLAGEMLDWWIARVRTEAIAQYKLDMRELAVLRLNHEGLKVKEIAYEMDVAVTVVYALIRKLKAKFNVAEISDATRIANVRGILNYSGV